MKKKHPSYYWLIPPVSFDITRKTMFTEGFDKYTEFKNIISERDSLRNTKQNIIQLKDCFFKAWLMKGLIQKNSQ